MSRLHAQDRAWTFPLLAALLATIPAFYAELLSEHPGSWPTWVYATAAVVLLAGLLQRRAGRGTAPSAPMQVLDLLLAAGLIAAALAPPSHGSPSALALRLTVALPTLLRMALTLRPLLSRGGLLHTMALALATLLACGAGYWWLEPSTPSLGQGLWLAFVTAATVGYGDVYPTTPASKIFSVFVVLLGYGVFSLVTAAIAAAWVGGEERRIEREILRDLHVQLGELRAELRALRDQQMPPG